MGECCRNISRRDRSVSCGRRIQSRRTQDELVGGLDYNKFKQETALDHIPLLGPLLNLFIKRGVYSGDYLLHWISDCLEKKGIKTFGQLIVPGEKDPRFKYKLQVMTSDITKEQILILPQGLSHYGTRDSRGISCRAGRADEHEHSLLL